MRKALCILALAAICGGTLYYFRDDIPWSIDASSDQNGPNPIADIDQPLPRTVLFSLDQRWVDLSSYKGQVVFVQFFATWCSGCVDEVPSLIRFQRRFGDKGFTVVALAIDDEGEESVESFVKNRQFTIDGVPMSINYPVLKGTMEIAQNAGFEGGLPSGIIVNREGREVKIIRGVVSETKLEKAIQRVVKD